MLKIVLINPCCWVISFGDSGP